VERLQNRLFAAGAAPSEPQASVPPRALEIRDFVLLREKTSLRMVETGEIYLQGMAKPLLLSRIELRRLRSTCAL
jgi:hypothetical protein